MTKVRNGRKYYFHPIKVSLKHSTDQWSGGGPTTGLAKTENECYSPESQSSAVSINLAFLFNRRSVGVKDVSAPEDLVSYEAGTTAGQLLFSNYSCRRRGHQNSSLHFHAVVSSMGASCHGSQAAKQPPCRAVEWPSVFPICSSPPKVGILCLPLFVCARARHASGSLGAQERHLQNLAPPTGSPVFFCSLLFYSLVQQFLHSFCCGLGLFQQKVICSPLQCNAVILYASRQNTSFLVYSWSVCV